MSAKVGLLITPELCIGCRACQVACKSWKQLPAEKTANKGSFENPSDLSASVFNKIRYVEVPSDKDPVRWLFVSQRCMHCEDAGCMKICPSPGALYKTKEGIVAYNKDKCIGCKLCIAGCPFNVPRYDEKDKISKCNLCSERVAEGLSPACAKTCPTGSLTFGNRDELIAKAQKAGYTKVYGQNDLGGLTALYAFKDAPKVYGMQDNPQIPESIVFWHKTLKPLAVWGLGGVVTASLLHYVIVGPKKDDKEEVK